ncbi:MAG: hypothetical protein QW053_02230 [Candidatus Nitrosocaldus sp.]
MRMLHMLEGDDVHSIYNLNSIASRTAELYMDFRVYRAKSKVRGL